jgi:hypothetical protein
VGTVRVEVKIKASPGDHEIDHAAIAALAFSPGVQRDIHRRAENVANFMRFRVGVKTGELLSTIRTEEAPPAVLATAGRAGQTPQLGYQMYGTSAHVIRPRTAGGTLVFYWDKVGAVVYFKKVNHPGTRKNDFVTPSVYAAAG